MARWKLMGPHYLNVEGTEWEYKETDRKTGREIRKKLPVPMFLDPRDPSECNYQWGNRDNQEGEIIVCWKGRGEDRDIVFHGNPTPDMVPLDAEAEEISASFTELWRYKPEVDPGTYSQSLVDRFQIEMAAVKSETKPAQVEGMAELISTMTKLVEHIGKPDRRV